jgi:adenylosuccinate lyase
MRALWSDQRKYEIWLEIETLACEAMAGLGQIPAEDARAIRERARFSIPEILEIEKRTNHDVIAFLENVASSVGPAARWMHQGLTSSDILDTTLAVQMASACDLLVRGIDEVRAAAAEQARAHKFTPMMGRSHGIHAEPVTFGLKMALMFDEFGRVRERLLQMRERVAVGKLSGAVGTRAHLDPRVEEEVCTKLGLRPATLSTQVVQRDRHAEFVTVLALAASSVDRWATEFRHLQRTEVLEVEEYFAAGQKGSSAMPHKRNPITGERLSGLARVIRGFAVTAMENVALWHERDISHSSAERIILPDGCTLLDYMLFLLARLVRGLQVYPENMLANMEKSRGLYASQAVLLKLTEKGLERQSAYEAVQRAALKTWAGDGEFLANLSADPEISAALSPAELQDACGLDRHFRHVDHVFRALGLEG